MFPDTLVRALFYESYICRGLEMTVENQASLSYSTKTVFILRKTVSNSDGQQLHKYQQNEQPLVTLTQ